MNKEPFETMPDVMDAKQLAQALHLSKAGAYNFLSNPDFPTLQISGRKLVMKQDLIVWPKRQTQKQKSFTGWMQTVCSQSRRSFSTPFFKRHRRG